MSVPNSHTRAFTTIPSSIRKTWSAAPIAAKDGKVVDYKGVRHEHSLIESVRVEINFNRAIQDGLDIVAGFDESETDAIIAWQEARRGWANVERAVADAVDSMIKTTIERAAKNGMQTVDVLRVQRTDADKESDKQSESERFDEARRQVSFADRPNGCPSTIAPNDSASVVTLTQSALEDMMERLSARKKSRGKAPKAASTLLQYTAGTLPRRRTDPLPKSS